MSQREVRLVSAGVPISDAFQAAVEEIIDNGSASFDGLAKRIEEVMRFKETRLIREAAWRTWADFAADIVTQLLEVGTITYINDKYYAPEFVRGVEYSAIPTANPKVVYTVWDERTRLERDVKAQMLMDVRRHKGDAQTFLDRYPDADPKIIEHYKNIVGRHSTVEKQLTGHEVSGQEEGKVKTKGPQDRQRYGLARAVDDYLKEYPSIALDELKVGEYWNQRRGSQGYSGPEITTSSHRSTIRRRLKTLAEEGVISRRIDKVTGRQTFKKSE